MGRDEDGGMRGSSDLITSFLNDHHSHLLKTKQCGDDYL